MKIDSEKLKGKIEVKEITKEEIASDSDLKQKMEHQAFVEKIENIARNLLIEEEEDEEKA